MLPVAIRTILIISGLIGLVVGIYFFFVPIATEEIEPGSETDHRSVRPFVMMWLVRLCFVAGGLANCAVAVFAPDKMLLQLFTPRHLRN